MRKELIFPMARMVKEKSKEEIKKIRKRVMEMKLEKSKKLKKEASVRRKGIIIPVQTTVIEAVCHLLQTTMREARMNKGKKSNVFMKSNTRM